VTINAPVTASEIGNLIQMTATTGDLNINAAITASASGALVQLNAGHDINVNAPTGLTLGGVVSASGGGRIVFVADTLGVPGPTGGAVNICPACAVTSTSVTIYYSPPNGYGSPTPYTGFTAYEWVFVEANNKVYDGTTAATARFYGDPTVAGTIVVGLTGGTISFVDKNVGIAKAVDFSGYSLDGSGSAAYALFAGTGITTAAITPAPLTVTANSGSKTYGQTATLSPTAFTAVGLQGSDTISSVSESSLGTVATAAVAGSPYIVTASNAAGGGFSAANYSTTYVSGALAVTPAPLTVTANNAVKTYGQSVTFGPMAFTSTGLRNGDTIVGVTETSLGALATAAVAGSPYTIVPSNAVGGTYVSSNYTTTYLPGTLAITPAALTITANSLTKTYGEAVSLSPSAFTASGLQNGDTIGGVTEASAGAAASAPVAGSPYAITAGDAVGGSFVPSNYSTAYAAGSLAVTPAALTVTANNAIKTFGQAVTFPPTAFTASGLRNGDSISGVTETSPGAAAAAAVATYAITPSDAVGSSFNPTNYQTTYAAGVLTTLAAVPPPVVLPPVVTPPVVVTPVAASPAGEASAGNDGATPAGIAGTSSTVASSAETPNAEETPLVDTLPGFMSPSATRAHMIATAAMGGSGSLAAGVPLVLVGGGVRMPVFAPAATYPAEAAAADASAGEYPPKPDRN
jgi:hypothetical protein